MWASGVTLSGGAVFTSTGGTATLGVLGVAAGGTLSGHGQVDGRVSVGAGGVIEASGGGWMLGTSSSTTGFVSDGTLIVGANYATLYDADAAELGALTRLGDETGTGMLMAMNGISIGAGEVIEGWGHVHADVAMDGTADGNLGEGLFFRRRVEGNGQFKGNVQFWGDVAPGHSTGLMMFENATLNGGTLFIELGGCAECDYDRLEGTGCLNLGGSLDVVFVNGFTPAEDQCFDLFDAGCISGEFWSLELPDLGPALAWDTSRLYTDGELRTLGTIPEPGTLALVSLSALGFFLRLRRRTRR